MIEDDSISGNLVTTIFDHYAQFLLIKNLSNKNNIANTKVYHPDFQKINEKKMGNYLQNTKWDNILELNRGDIDKSCESFFSIIKCIYDKHAPLKKMSLKDHKLKLKPGLTKVILTSVNNKNKIYPKYCPTSMQHRSDVSFSFHIGRDIADHAQTSSRRRNWYVNEMTYLRRLCDVSLVRK